jgi:hypothetical protein
MAGKWIWIIKSKYKRKDIYFLTPLGKGIILLVGVGYELKLVTNELLVSNAEETNLREKILLSNGVNFLLIPD